MTIEMNYERCLKLYKLTNKMTELILEYCDDLKKFQAWELASDLVVRIHEEEYCDFPPASVYDIDNDYWIVDDCE